MSLPELRNAAKTALTEWDSLCEGRLLRQANAVMDTLAAEGHLNDGFLPDARHVFRAFAALSPTACRVVVLGQDPYPNPEDAMGLAFSSPATKLPASLRNIFKELQVDVGIPLPLSGDLSGWLRQGVMLANVGLTLGLAANGRSHLTAWHEFARTWIEALAAGKPIVWILWGKHAQRWKPLIEERGGRRHIIIESVHPSPLSAHRGFFGSKPFSKTNAALQQLGLPAIDWSRSGART